MPYSVWPTASCCTPSPANGVPNTSGAVQAPRTNGVPGVGDSPSIRLSSGGSRTANSAGIATYISTNSPTNGWVDTHSSDS